MKSNIAVGIIKPSVGVVSYLDLNLNNKGTYNCIPNVGIGLEPGDVVSGWKDANIYWLAAIYKGGDPKDRANYTPLNEIVMDFVCPLPPPTPDPTPDPPVPALPLLDFYYEGFWESGDTIHQPEINSWVDYLDEFGVQYRFMIGGIENGCQLVQASSIVNSNGCGPCSDGLYITSQPEQSDVQGILSFFSGQPNEIIYFNLEESLDGSYFDDDFIFSGSLTIESRIGNIRTGNITLDINGNVQSHFYYNLGNTSYPTLLLTITGRSSGRPIPIDNQVYIEKHS